MAEAVRRKFSAIHALKTNNSGNLTLKNGRLWNTAASTYSTIGTPIAGNEAVAANAYHPLTRAKGTTATANLTISSGEIHAVGIGPVELIG